MTTIISIFFSLFISFSPVDFDAKSGKLINTPKEQTTKTIEQDLMGG